MAVGLVWKDHRNGKTVSVCSFFVKVLYNDLQCIYNALVEQPQKISHSLSSSTPTVYDMGHFNCIAFKPAGMVQTPQHFYSEAGFLFEAWLAFSPTLACFPHKCIFALSVLWIEMYLFSLYASSQTETNSFDISDQLFLCTWQIWNKSMRQPIDICL